MTFGGRQQHGIWLIDPAFDPIQRVADTSIDERTPPVTAPFMNGLAS